MKQQEINTSIQSVLNTLNIFPERIAGELSNVGLTSLTKMTITLTKTTPTVHRFRQFSDKEREEVRMMVNELLKNGIIGESSLAYASRIVLVPKKTGENRLYVDYRDLNKITVKDT